MPDEPIDPNTPPPITARPLLLQPINGQQSGLNRQRNRKKRLIVRIVAIVAAVIIGSGLAAWLWYGVQLSPFTNDKQKLIAVTIESGSSPSQIGRLLQAKSIIRSSLAFDINTRLSGTRGQLQAGTYRLSPGESTPVIVEHLVSGKVDEFNITFLPGATLKQDRQVLVDAGFATSEIDAAFSKTYDSPLFNSKPAGSDLEGYIYGQTYRFNGGDTAEAVLQRTFDEFAKVIQANNLEAGFRQQGLTLYQGITLASIVQREVGTPHGSDEPSSDQKQVAQVFYSRLATSMMLGSDVTYQYAADKLGVARDVNLDSPYNTRRYTGLPPGPIASPGLTALKAVAAPASGDYLFFLSGDDGLTYFARTEAEHQANIKDHCAVKCSAL
jgi:UPF0755 protein